MPEVRSVFEVTQLVKRLLEGAEELAGVTVRGEISNFNRPASGHLYFTLKDDKARLRVVMFAGKARFLRFSPEDGMRVVVSGSISVFERTGDYQLYAETVQPDGIGALFLAYRQLQERLAKEGLFDEGRKRPLPAFPARIALVTSGTGAAVQDMIITLRRRYPAARVLVVPVAVQGEEAPRQIAEAVSRVSLHRLADVMIVGRGGGSFEELFAFNTEQVARAIFSSDIPVVSAVGHETDVTIADFVADVRAATPTAAAELVSQHAVLLPERLETYERRMLAGAVNCLRRLSERVERAASSRTLAEPGRAIALYGQRIDEWERTLRSSLAVRLERRLRALSGLQIRLARQAPAERLRSVGIHLEALADRQARAVRRVLEAAAGRLEHDGVRLSLLDPLSIMRRGFAVVYRQPVGQVVTLVDAVQPGDSVHVRLSDGWLDCQVWGVHRVGEAER